MEKTLKSNTVFKGRVITLKVDDVECENGAKSIREIIHVNGGVCVLLEVDNKIAFVKQYRYAYKEEMLELPAGKLEINEDPYEAGIRELEEEVGYKAESLIPMGKIYPSCGFLDEVIHLYVAKNVSKSVQHFDFDEELKIFWYTKEEIMSMLNEDKIKDAKTLILLSKYLLLNKGEK